MKRSDATIAVTFVEPSGDRRTVRVEPGQTLMDAAFDADIDGLVGQCGGAINCATCLCDLADDALAALPAQHADEMELLSYVDEASTNSRLTCQIVAQPELDGLILRVLSPTA